MEKTDQKLADLAASGRMLGEWVLKGGLSILDLVIYSGSMFLVSVLLARWMSVENYGIFALAMVITTLFYQMQNSLILEPMSVIGPSKYSQILPQYLSRQRIFHFVLFFILGFSIIILSVIYRVVGGATQLFTILILLGLLAALLQLPWMIRRSFYVMGLPFSAVLYSLVFAFVTVGCLYLLKINKWLSTESTLVLLSVSGLIAVVFIYKRLHRQPAEKGRFDGRTIWEENWGFGKWMLPSGLCFFAAGQAPIMIAGLTMGAEASGVIKAMQNYMVPMVMIISTLISVAVPRLAEGDQGADEDPRNKQLNIIVILIITISAIYGVVLTVFAVPMETFLYSGNYSAFNWLIPFWVWMPFLMALGALPSIYFRLTKRTKAIFQSALAWMIVTLMAATLFAKAYGILGISLGTIAGYIAYSGTYLIIYLKVRGEAC